jgi:hypothetical protein
VTTNIERLRKTTTVSVPEAAAALGIGLSLAYAQAATGHIGEVRVLKIGHRMVVPTRHLLRALGEDDA